MSVIFFDTGFLFLHYFARWGLSGYRGQIGACDDADERLDLILAVSRRWCPLIAINLKLTVVVVAFVANFPARQLSWIDSLLQ